MFSGTRGHNKIMKNKDFNLIEFLKQKNIFVSNEDIKNKSMTLTSIIINSFGQLTPEPNKILSNSITTNVMDRSRNKNLTSQVDGVIIFVDFKTKQIITNKRGLKNV